MSRKNGQNRDIVSVSFDRSHEYQGKQKVVRYLVPQNNTTIDLIATSNYDHKLVNADDKEEEDLPTWDLRTTIMKKKTKTISN